MNPAASQYRAAARPGTRAPGLSRGSRQGPGCARPVTAADCCLSRGGGPAAADCSRPTPPATETGSGRRRQQTEGPTLRRPLPQPAADRGLPPAADRGSSSGRPPTAACRLLPAGTMSDAGAPSTTGLATSRRRRRRRRRRLVGASGRNRKPAAAAIHETEGLPGRLQSARQPRLTKR